MGTELYAFTDALDAAAVTASILIQALNTKVPTQMYTDSKQCFDVYKREKHLAKNCLATSIAAARKAYERLGFERVS